MSCTQVSRFFQFTPLREGRRRRAVRKGGHLEISIHAPPRGATRGRCAVRADDIFQFTPLREGRLFQVFCIPTEEIFQFTPLREGRRPHLEQLGRHVYFNSRPSARGDPLRFCSLQPLQDFNSRPSARGDSRIAARCKLTLHFNSRPSARGDTYGSQGRRGLCYFNSRPSARGDRREVRKPHRGGISIHAPPRGATSACTSGLVFPHLFQFTPLREGRLGQNAGKRRGIYFNSRPSARGDITADIDPDNNEVFQFTPLREGRRQFVIRWLFVFISIHAPPRGATGGWRRLALVHRRFQFTPLREGRRMPRGTHPNSLAISIHAPPRGATPQAPPCRRLARYFNSRPSARGDEDVEGVLQKAKHFNSRPSARGDAAMADISAIGKISIHAPPRGATGLPHHVRRAGHISIHAPPRGATGFRRHGGGHGRHFNSRPSARGDLICIWAFLI